VARVKVWGRGVMVGLVPSIPVGGSVKIPAFIAVIPDTREACEPEARSDRRRCLQLLDSGSRFVRPE